MKTYTIHQLIGNYSSEVFTSDNFYEIQDYLENQLNFEIEAGNIDPDDDADIQNFYSYYHIEEK